MVRSGRILKYSSKFENDRIFIIKKNLMKIRVRNKMNFRLGFQIMYAFYIFYARTIESFSKKVIATKHLQI